MEGIALSVSVIIRNRNEADYLPHVFQALSIQEKPALEIIFVDNESTDNSVDIARKYGAKILTLEKNSFTYGKALNMGISHAKGDLCLILSAHSLPMGHNFIRECVKPFTNIKIAAARNTYAGKEADIFNWLYPEILDSTTDFNKIIKKGPLGSGCVIRRSVWEQHPFNEAVKSAEDKIWAMEVISKGYSIYASTSAVYTYIKHYSRIKQLKNDYRDSLALYKYTGVKIGFINRSPVKAMAAFLYSVIKIAPLSAFNVIKQEFYKTLLTLSLRSDAKK